MPACRRVAEGRCADLRLALAATAILLAGLPVSTGGPVLSIRTEAGWQVWWHSDSAPARWAGPHPVVAAQLRWRPVADGVEWAQLSMSGSGEAFRVRVIVVRLDPTRLDLHLVHPPPGRVVAGRWAIDEAPDDAVFAVNAGQFVDGPWGWVVEEFRERQSPGSGPLAPAVVVDSTGAVGLVMPDAIAGQRGRVRLAFQSYPTLLSGDGSIPAQLVADERGIDREHRDARLALGTLRDGKVLVAMTRFEGLGGMLLNLPLGFTTPEMAAVMGALGARDAVLLDGGISCQLLLRGPGVDERWPGWRKVALGLVALPRTRDAGQGAGS